MGNPLGLGNLYLCNIFPGFLKQIQDFWGRFSLPSVDGHGFFRLPIARPPTLLDTLKNSPKFQAMLEHMNSEAETPEAGSERSEGLGAEWLGISDGFAARKMMETGTRRPQKRAEEKWSRERPSGPPLLFLFFLVLGF